MLEEERPREVQAGAATNRMGKVGFTSGGERGLIPAEVQI
jgi:hypothetical protein